MSNLPPTEPPRFVLPGSEPADPATPDPTTPVDGDVVDPAAGPVVEPTDVQEPAPTDPPAGDYAPGSLEAAIAAVLDAPDDAPAPLEAGNPAPADGEAGSEDPPRPRTPLVRPMQLVPPLPLPTRPMTSSTWATVWLHLALK